MDVNETIHQLMVQLWNLSFNRYLTKELFSVQWWALLILLAVFYTIWIKLVDKGRLMELLLFGSFVSVMSAVSDIYGISTAHWQYNIRIFPIFPAPFPFDYTLVPILLMLSYQYSRTWPRYLLNSALASVFFSFAFMPLSKYTGIKSFYNWSNSYFFMLMMLVAATARLAILIVIRIVEKNRATGKKI